MLKLMRLLTIICLFFGLGTMTYAASPNPVSSAYVQSYFTTIAAASCLGVYLPHTSQEFDYLRSYGWQIESQQGNDGKVEMNYAVAKNYFPQINKQIYLVTFRGSASKSDWKINLATKKVNYGGSTLAEMQELAAQPVIKDGATVHAGFNSYVDAVLRSGVVDENSKLAEIYGRETSINSFHHQSIKHLASDLRVIARDPEDNTVEAVESNSPDLRFLGVQWHPELLLDKREEDLKLFEYVVNEL